jgi:hypothetical protein
MKKLIVREHTHIHIHTITALVVNKTIISLYVRRTINAQDVPHAPQGGDQDIYPGGSNSIPSSSHSFSWTKDEERRPCFLVSFELAPPLPTVT